MEPGLKKTDWVNLKQNWQLLKEKYSYLSRPKTKEKPTEKKEVPQQAILFSQGMIVLLDTVSDDFIFRLAHPSFLSKLLVKHQRILSGSFSGI